MDEGEAAPAALVNQPELPDHLTFAWDAFWKLSGDRALGFGAVGPIPWSAINAFADRAGITGTDEFDRLLSLVKALDAAFRDHMREQEKKA